MDLNELVKVVTVMSFNELKDNSERLFANFPLLASKLKNRLNKFIPLKEDRNKTLALSNKVYLVSNDKKAVVLDGNIQHKIVNSLDTRHIKNMLEASLLPAIKSDLTAPIASTTQPVMAPQ